MGLEAIQLPQRYQIAIDRFVAVCQSDPRVIAAFLGGSYAGGKADAYSDLDLGLITTDGTYKNFLAGREAFIGQLGEPLLKFWAFAGADRTSWHGYNPLRATPC